MSTAIVHQHAARLILERMRAEWILWLGLTTSLDPYGGPRTPATRRADAALCHVVNGEPIGAETIVASRAELC